MREDNLYSGFKLTEHNIRVINSEKDTLKKTDCRFQRL